MIRQIKTKGVPQNCLGFLVQRLHGISETWLKMRQDWSENEPGAALE
jgi:hypothetical protein